MAPGRRLDLADQPLSPPAAIANAVEDALAPFGVRVTRAPVTPSGLRDAIDRARR